ncbi:MAG TPA: hypothetical protein PLV68_08615, partial [Ilumatobacteraceae bacterium]|nr:hypothetical protein [Ilumatobacteraceae bacterium]
MQTQPRPAYVGQSYTGRGRWRGIESFIVLVAAMVGVQSVTHAALISLAPGYSSAVSALIETAAVTSVLAIGAGQ